MSQDGIRRMALVGGEMRSFIEQIHYVSPCFGAYVVAVLAIAEAPLHAVGVTERVYELRPALGGE